MTKTFSSQIYQEIVGEGIRQKREQIINKNFY